VLLRLQLREELDPVTAIVYGGGSLQPMDGGTTFILRLTNTEPLCEKTLAGIVVRTESGQRGIITVNGVDIELESAVFITAPNRALLTITNLTGTVTVNARRLGQQQVPGVGEFVPVIQVNERPVFIGEPRSDPNFDTSPLHPHQWLINDEEGLGLIREPEEVAIGAPTAPPPVVTPTPFVPLAPPCTPFQPPGWEPYTVAAGDTLSALSVERSVSVQQLITVNCLAGTIIRVGETLFVPPAPPTPTP
jgi:hypothetical protein